MAGASLSLFCDKLVLTFPSGGQVVQDSQEVILGSEGEAAAGSCISRTPEPPTASFPKYDWVDLLVAFRAYNSLNKLRPNAQPLGDHVGDSEERDHGSVWCLMWKWSPDQETLPTSGTLHGHLEPFATMVHQPRKGPGWAQGW